MGHEAMRAGDSDRQKVADQLKSALDEGRLDLNEYDERVQKAYAARTYGDLDGLLDDLPGAIPVQRARVEPYSPPAPAPYPVEPAHGTHSGKPRVAPAVGAFLICVVIWTITSVSSGELLYFWPAWVLIPVVVALAAHFSDRNKRRD
ncbi:DUF1707 domain-containing protein [Actinoplanes sp. NPDC024001]|uniref:DUF1707 SHOCT-like domain-containing protein n=1 Tax=Actinoplanes sp. NPDC024001 TaxID=3154598 RepID=UPI0033FDABD1